jgi:hypothetical protein
MNRVCWIVLFVTIVLIHSASNIFAYGGDNIPSGKEIEYAQQMYKLIKAFDQQESSFVEKMQNVPVSQHELIKKAFKDKFNYTKDFYLQSRQLVPTTKFAPVHQKMLEGIYGNLQYLKKVCVELENGKNLQEASQSTIGLFKSSNKIYEKAVVSFMDIIKSWQRPYMEKVTGPPPQAQPK